MQTLSDRIDSIEQNGLAGLTELMAEVKKGSVPLEAIKKHYAARYAPRVKQLMTAWQAGRLFGAQTESWNTFLMGANLRHDRQAWLDFQADFWMASVKLDEAVALFASRRIMQPEPSLRAKALNDGGLAEAMRQTWVNDNQRHGWGRWGSQ